MEETNTEIMETEEPETVSGNDIDTETPDNTGSEDQTGEQDNENIQDNVPDHADHEDNSSEPVTDTADTEWQDQITAQLQILSETDDNTDVTERLDALIDLLTLEAEADVLSEEASVTIPIEGYKDWNYGITVYFKVYPFGLGNYMDSSAVCFEPEDFESWYQDMFLLIDDTIRDFYITTITDDNGTEVYNYETYVEPDTEEPDTAEEPDGEEDTVSGQLLSHLENINLTLSDMLASDMEYYQSQVEYQEKMLELQTAETADTIIMCVTMFIILGAMCAKAFVERLK